MCRQNCNFFLQKKTNVCQKQQQFFATIRNEVILKQIDFEYVKYEFFLQIILQLFIWVLAELDCVMNELNFRTSLEVKMCEWNQFHK